MPHGDWDDTRLNRFYQEFRAHREAGEIEQAQTRELYQAVFQREDPERNIPPGLLQNIATITGQLHDILVRQDRQKTFIGGVLFAVSGVWLFFTDIGHKLMTLVAKL